ncbi:hypothetical protein BaRGS_00017001 [Batillaria attramentaria]|uniref:Secreted protein n=1 Tax=Batillaria attramentaria TaxID=370345 RepID=A0ABD0KXH9_9CAEN
MSFVRFLLSHGRFLGEARATSESGPVPPTLHSVNTRRFVQSILVRTFWCCCSVSARVEGSSFWLGVRCAGRLGVLGVGGAIGRRSVAAVM